MAWNLKYDEATESRKYEMELVKTLNPSPTFSASINFEMIPKQ
jgi:hypothetical protein